jgi:hypothetical protein
VLYDRPIRLHVRRLPLYPSFVPAKNGFGEIRLRVTTAAIQTYTTGSFAPFARVFGGRLFGLNHRLSVDEVTVSDLPGPSGELLEWLDITATRKMRVLPKVTERLELRVTPRDGDTDALRRALDEVGL